MLIAPLTGPKPPPIQPVPPVRRRPHAIQAPADGLSVRSNREPAGLPARADTERQTRLGSSGKSPLSAQTAFALLQVQERDADRQGAAPSGVPQQQPAPDQVAAGSSTKAATAAYAQGLQAGAGFAFARPADVLDMVA